MAITIILTVTAASLAVTEGSVANGRPAVPSNGKRGGPEIWSPILFHYTPNPVAIKPSRGLRPSWSCRAC